MDPAYVELGGGADAIPQPVDLLKGLPEPTADAPDIVGDHRLGDAHAVELDEGLHVVGDDLAVGEPGGQLLEVLMLHDVLEVLPVVLAPAWEGV